MVSYFGLYFTQSPRIKRKPYNYEVSCLFVYQSFQFGNDSEVGSFWETLTTFECKLWKISKKFGCCSKLSCATHSFTDLLNFKLNFQFSVLLWNVESSFSFNIRLWLRPVKLSEGFFYCFCAFLVCVSSQVCKTKYLWKSQKQFAIFSNLAYRLNSFVHFSVVFLGMRYKRMWGLSDEFTLVQVIGDGCSLSHQAFLSNTCCSTLMARGA